MRQHFIRPFCLIALFLRLSAPGISQHTTMWYADTMQRLQVNITTAPVLNDSIYAYFPARAGNGATQINVLVKTDTSGATCWTSYPLLYPRSPSVEYYRQYKRLIKGCDGDLYGLLEDNRIIKINDQHGGVEWMNIVFNGHADYLRDQLADYDKQHFLFARADYSTGGLQIFKVEKSAGRKVDSIHLFMPSIGAAFGAGRSYALHVAGTQLLVATKDSCFRYASFDAPELIWKARHGIELLHDVARVTLYNNQVLVFGNKESGFQNGYITTVDFGTGSFLWTSRNQGTYDVQYADHKIKDGFLYTAWKHQYVGSTSERCLVNKVNLATGAMQWQHNHWFRTQPVNVAVQEGITHLVLDNEFIYLTGYALPDQYDKQSWIFMKLRQTDGQIVLKSFVENSHPDRDYPIWYSLKLINNQLYATGFHNLNNATLRLDKALQAGRAPMPVKAAIQYPSRVMGIQPFSATKKLILRQQGKQLTLTMTDPFYNEIWQYPVGDTLHYYEGIPYIGVTDSNRHIYVSARRYNYFQNDFYFYAREYSDSLFVHDLDSNGVLLQRYRFDDDPQVNPTHFFADSSGRRWMATTTPSLEAAAPLDTLMAGPADIINPRPYATPWRHTIFHHRADSVMMFRERGYYGGASFTKQGSPYWYPSTKQHFLRGLKWIHTVEKQDSAIYFVAGKDSANRDLVFRFHADSLREDWRQVSDTNLVTLRMFSTPAGLYAFGQKGQQLWVRHLSADSGKLWSAFPVAPSLPHHRLQWNDISFSVQRGNFAVAGYLTDTTGIPENTKLFVSQYDLSGKPVFTLIQGGFKAWQNKALVLATGQDGQTLAGGQLSDPTRDYAAVMYGLDPQQLATAPADTVYTLAAGSWHDPAIWSTGQVPGHERHVLVLHPITITRNVICRTLDVQAPGTLHVAPGILVEVKPL